MTYLIAAAILLVGQHVPYKQHPHYRELWRKIVIESHRQSQQEWEETMGRTNPGWDRKTKR